MVTRPGFIDSFDKTKFLFNSPTDAFDIEKSEGFDESFVMLFVVVVVVFFFLHV